MYTAGGVTSGFLLDRARYIAVNIAGSTTTRATDINSQGVIVGWYDDATGSHGFIWNDGVVVTLDVPGAIATSPNGINDAGTVVGLINTPGGIDGIERGFVYRDGEFRVIDYPNASGTTLLDINNADTALGGYVNLTPAYPQEWRVHGRAGLRSVLHGAERDHQPGRPDRPAPRPQTMPLWEPSRPAGDLNWCIPPTQRVLCWWPAMPPA